MGKTDLRDRVLNIYYPDKHRPGQQLLGNQIQVRAAMPMIGANPTVLWFYELRCLVPEDQDYVKKGLYPDDAQFVPELVLPHSFDYAYRRFKIPHHGGIQYSLYARLGGGGTQLVKQFTTWRRLYIDVRAQTAEQLQLVHQAFPRIAAAYAEAYIEAVLSQIKVGAEVRQPSKDPSPAREGTSTVVLQLEAEKEGASWQDLVCELRKRGGGYVLERVNDRQPNADPQRPHLSIEEGALRITQRFPKARWAPAPFFLRGLSLQRLDDQVLGPTFQCFSNELAHSTWNEELHQSAQRIDDQTVAIRLGHSALAGWLGRLSDGDRCKLELKLELRMMGLDRGGVQGVTNVATITVSPKSTAAAIACTVVHEIGHILGLAVSSEKRANGQVVMNAKHYEGHGGNGNHCKHNVQNPDAPAGVPYRPPENANPLCVMFHATVPEHMPQARFCPTCLGHLRRRPVPALSSAAKAAAPAKPVGGPDHKGAMPPGGPGRAWDQKESKRPGLDEKGVGLQGSAPVFTPPKGAQ